MNRIDDKSLERLLSGVQRPARYTGGELNQIVKADAAVRMALCYPDLYEVGMSNHGIQVLYAIANGIEGVACERVFSVPPDFENRIRALGLTLFTLETHTTLNSLDMIGFNLSHELIYTNVLQVLELGRIPLRSRDRGDAWPVVIAGGSAASNPAPMGAFIDAYYIGDGEEGIVDIVNSLKRSKMNGLTRTRALAELESIEGIYLPVTHEAIVRDGAIHEIKGRRIRKRIFRSRVPLDPEHPVVPNIRIAQERAVVEVSRGCANLCKFCHAGYYDLPCRQYAPETLRERIFRIIENTGYNELTLSALSIGDYRHIAALLEGILPELTERGVSISLPSLRVDLDTLPLIELVSDLRRTSLTFAVESAQKSIRRLANKRLSTDDLLRIIETVFKKGWRIVKLYFMIGLPGCMDFDEAGAIVELLWHIDGLVRGKKEINVTVSPFTPKPHTPFQWERQMDETYIEEAVKKIRRGAPRSAKVKNHDTHASLLEGVLSRGDGSLAEVIHGAYVDGARLDSWSEHFNFDLWAKNLQERIPDWRRFLDARHGDDVFPWSAVLTGFEPLVIHEKERSSPQGRRGNRPSEKFSSIEAFNHSIERFKQKYAVMERIRLRLAKRGNSKYIPHIDFIEIVKRAMRMAELPVSFTQGFNKRERISMGHPLPVGIESICELCDVELFESIAVDGLIAGLNKRLPPGIEVLAVERADVRESLMSLVNAVEYRVSFDSDDRHKRMLDSLEGGRSIIKETKNGTREIGLEQAVLGWRAGDSEIDLILRAGGDDAVRIDRVVLAFTGSSMEDLYRIGMLRTRQMTAEGIGLMERDIKI